MNNPDELFNLRHLYLAIVVCIKSHNMLVKPELYEFSLEKYFAHYVIKGAEHLAVHEYLITFEIFPSTFTSNRNLFEW